MLCKDFGRTMTIMEHFTRNHVSILTMALLSLVLMAAHTNYSEAYHEAQGAPWQNMPQTILIVSLVAI